MAYMEAMWALSWALSAAAAMAMRGAERRRASTFGSTEFEAAAAGGGVDEDRRGVQVTEALSRSLLAGSAR